MKTIKLKPTDLVIDFIVPPERQGQIVEVSFAWAVTENIDCILRRVIDKSDGSFKIEAYRHGGDQEFDPWNQTPRLGRRIGRVVIQEEA